MVVAPEQTTVKLLLDLERKSSDLAQGSDVGDLVAPSERLSHAGGGAREPMNVAGIIRGDVSELHTEIRDRIAYMAQQLTC